MSPPFYMSIISPLGLEIILVVRGYNGVISPRLCLERTWCNNPTDVPSQRVLYYYAERSALAEPGLADRLPKKRLLGFEQDVM